VFSNVYWLRGRDAVDEGRYWVALFNRCGEGAGVERNRSHPDLRDRDGKTVPAIR
jgi:hypothetical protein